MADHWGFYGRAKEIAEIERLLSSDRWFFCAISGRRRIGKTTLIREALRGASEVRGLYVQIPDSDHRGVVQAFRDALEDSRLAENGFGPDPATIRDFSDLARAIDHLCRAGVVVVMDEFQYFHRAALFPFTSHLQAVVDRLRGARGGGLFVLGSIHTEMTALLEDQSSPLFARVTDRLFLTHWDFATLFEMFAAHGITEPLQMLSAWTLFEGVPKFYRDCFEQGVLRASATFRETMVRRMFFEGTSPLRDEAENWFLKELRGRYDSALKLIARMQPCSHGDLLAEYRALGDDDKQLAAYLRTLIERYQMVTKIEPIFAKPASRKSRYVITDNFLAAWLAAIARGVEKARIRPIDEAVVDVGTRLDTLEGFTFEKMVRALVEEASRAGSSEFHLSEQVRGYWDKPNRGNASIEIDLIAFDEASRKVMFCSCKRNAKKFTDASLRLFRDHVSGFLRESAGTRFSEFSHGFALFAPTFLPEDRDALHLAGFQCFDIGDLGAAVAPQLFAARG